jgi:hypothetical protein
MDTPAMTGSEPIRMPDGTLTSPFVRWRPTPPATTVLTVWLPPSEARWVDLEVRLGKEPQEAMAPPSGEHPVLLGAKDDRAAASLDNREVHA